MLLAGYLAGHGFRVSQIATGRELMDVMTTDAAALVLLDLGLPGEDGFAIARQLREHWHCGLVIVTGRGDQVDKVVGLEIGADDYVTKPFDLRELLARIKAVLRRSQPAAATPSDARHDVRGALTTAEPFNAALPALRRLRFADWVLEVEARRLISPDGQDVSLTTGEFDLLHLMAAHAGRVLTRDFMLEQTRKRESSPFDRTIDVQVGRLRKKLEIDMENPQLIKSVRGVGYMLAVKADPA